MYIGTFFFVLLFSSSLILSRSIPLALLSRSYTIPKQQTALQIYVSINLVSLLFFDKESSQFQRQTSMFRQSFLKARNVTESNQNSRVPPRRRIIKPSSLTEFVRFTKGYQRQIVREQGSNRKQYRGSRRTVLSFCVR